MLHDHIPFQITYLFLVVLDVWVVWFILFSVLIRLDRQFQISVAMNIVAVYRMHWGFLV